MRPEELLHAIQSLNAPDAFRPRLDAAQWRNFLEYLTPHELRAGDLVIRQGDADRTVYLLGRGSLQVYAGASTPGAVRSAILRPGALCGEAGLFADAPRAFNVEAMVPGVVWAMRLPRFEELGARAPAIALEVLRAAGAVMVIRSLRS